MNEGNSGANPGGVKRESIWVGLEEQKSIRDKLAFLGAFTSTRSYRSSITFWRGIRPATQAVLKTVVPKGLVGSTPTLSSINFKVINIISSR